MAGDWMKIELELPDKPEVHAIAGFTNIDPDAVVGKLIRIWQWFDKHTTDGNAHGVTYSLLDRISGVTGFGEAMNFAGWIVQNGTVLTMPKFDRHTSQSAKTRATTRVRVEKFRNAENVTKALPEKRREEKRKKEYKNNTAIADVLFPDIQDRQIVDDWVKVRKAKNLPVTKTAIQGFIREVDKSGWKLEDVVRLCCERGWGGFKAEWLATATKPIDIQKPTITKTPEQLEQESLERVKARTELMRKRNAETPIPVIHWD
jgi:hypothetical protein